MNALLLRLVDTSTFGVLLCNSVGQIFYMNAALRDMLGYSLARAESRELHWEHLTPPGYELVDQHAIAELHQTGRCAAYEKAYLSSDNSHVPVMVGASVVGQDETGDYIIAAYVTDLRPLKQTQAQAEAATLRVLHLQRVTAALANALTVDQVVGTIIAQVLRSFDAAACSVRRVSDDGLYLEELASVGYTPALAAMWHRISIDASLLVTAAVRRKQTLVVYSVAELRASYPDLLDTAEEHGYRVFAAVPLLREGKATGVIGIAFTDERLIDDQDIALLEAIGQQCEQALERARLYSAEQAARAEAAELLAQIDTVVGKAPIGMGFVDTDFRFVWVNEVLAGLNQLPVADHVGLLARDGFPDYVGLWEDYWRQVLDTGMPIVDLELSAVMHGEVFHALVSYYPVRLADGSIRGIGIVVLNITERRRNEQNQRLLARASAVLSESLDYEATLAAVTGLIVPEFADYCAVNLVEGDIVRTVALRHRDQTRMPLLEQLYSGTASLEHSRLPISSVLREGRPLLVDDLQPVVDHLPYTDQQRQLIRALNATSALVVPLIVRDTVLGAITFVYSDSTRHYTQDDLTLAEELARRCAQTLENVQLYHNEQNAVRLRDAFLSIAAHELRTPLTSLYGNAQMFQRRIAQTAVLPERDAHTLDVVVSQAARLNQMIGSVLDVSRLQHGQLAITRALFDLRGLVAQVAAEIQPMLHNHTLHVDLPEQPLMISGDELRLEQVVANLVQNGVKYTPSGGVVHLQCQLQGQHALISVADTGMGIPPEALPQLFQRFYRAPNALASNISGLGIGLYVVREIIQLHGGTITVESEEGVGTTFFIQLPLQ